MLGCWGFAGLEAALYFAGGLGVRPGELGGDGPDAELPAAAVPLLDEEEACAAGSTAEGRWVMEVLREGYEHVHGVDSSASRERDCVRLGRSLRKLPHAWPAPAGRTLGQCRA